MRTRNLLVGLFAASLFASACGSDGDDAGTGGSQTTAAGAAGSAAAAGESSTIRLWLNGSDTPQALVDYAIAEFNKTHPDVTVSFERQQWTGIVERLTTALSSSDSPDVVELGNTQAQAFEAAGALVDLTPSQDELGGDDFLQSLTEAGTYDGKLYAVPYYAGARVVIYRKDLFAKSGLQIPTTLDEFLAAGVKLKQDNADVPNFSGIYLPGRNWHAALTFLWAFGGDVASRDGDAWKGQLSSDDSVTGLTFVKNVIDQASAAPKDGDDSQDHVAFCNGEVGMMPAPGWKPSQIIDPEKGCPAMASNIGAFALPGLDAGTTSPVFLGGSNLGVSARSEHPELAVELLKVLTSTGYQEQFAAAGTIPARTSVLSKVQGDEAVMAQAAAAANSRFVPTSENWASVESANVLQDMLVAIAQGGDIRSEAQKADQAIETMLNA